MTTAPSAIPAVPVQGDVVRWTLDTRTLEAASGPGLVGLRVGDAMGRARRARRIAQTAAYGGGFGIAGIGVLGAVGYGLIKAEALLARMAVGIIDDAAPQADGVYGSAPGTPIELLVLGDSSAAGLGADTGLQTIGAILASGVSAFAGRRVRLTNVAVVGAVSGDLGVQVANALDRVPKPDAAVVLIGTNDVTHRIDKSIAVRHL
jgi:hypothetical protein